MRYLIAGEMAEWSIALPWKGSNWATGSGVRIPVSPPMPIEKFGMYVTNFNSSIKVNLIEKIILFNE